VRRRMLLWDHPQLTQWAGVNRQNPTVKGAFTFAEFIQHSYFPRLEYRLRLNSDDELHIEPSTVKGYKDIWKTHVEGKSIAKMPLRNFTARDGRMFLESLPQHLSHDTHQRIRPSLIRPSKAQIHSRA
jgi:hypothetical protein